MKVKKVVLALLLVSLALRPSVVWAANYGEGTYGSGDYNVGEISPTPTGTSTSASTTSSSSSSDPVAPVCADQPPGAKAPWLYAAVAQGSNSVLLYFTPADEPVGKYVLEYGTRAGDYPFGVQDLGVNSRSQMTFLVESLSPATTYYFRVRAGSGCAAGSWSNELSAQTQSLLSFNQLEITALQLETQPVEEAEPVPQACRTYTVSPGDSLWAVAQELLGDGNRYQELVEQNVDQYPSLQHSTALEAGWKLAIDCDGRQQAEAARRESEAEERAQGESKTFAVKVKVEDTAQQPVEGAKVAIHSTVQEAVTDNNGIAEFKNVEAGDHRVVVAYKGQTGEQRIFISAAENIKELVFTIQIKPTSPFADPLVLAVIGGLAVLVVVFGFIIVRARANRGQR